MEPVAEGRVVRATAPVAVGLEPRYVVAFVQVEAVVRGVIGVDRHAQQPALDPIVVAEVVGEDVARRSAVHFRVRRDDVVFDQAVRGHAEEKPAPVGARGSLSASNVAVCDLALQRAVKADEPVLRLPHRYVFHPATKALADVDQAAACRAVRAVHGQVLDAHRLGVASHGPHYRREFGGQVEQQRRRNRHRGGCLRDDAGDVFPIVSGHAAGRQHGQLLVPLDGDLDDFSNAGLGIILECPCVSDRQFGRSPLVASLDIELCPVTVPPVAAVAGRDADAAARRAAGPDDRLLGPIATDRDPALAPVYRDPPAAQIGSCRQIHDVIVSGVRNCLEDGRLSIRLPRLVSVVRGLGHVDQMVPVGGDAAGHANGHSWFPIRQTVGRNEFVRRSATGP